MPKEVVKQPNELFAIFSTIEDDFIEWGMTRDEVLRVIALMSSKEDALRLVEEADADLADDYELEDGATGSKRWNRAIEAIAGNRGIDEVAAVVEALGIDNFQILPYLQDISDALEEDRLRFGP